MTTPSKPQPTNVVAVFPIASILPHALAGSDTGLTEPTEIGAFSTAPETGRPIVGDAALSVFIPPTPSSTRSDTHVAVPSVTKVKYGIELPVNIYQNYEERTPQIKAEDQAQLAGTAGVLKASGGGKPSFIMWRGDLTKLAVLPWNTKDVWEMDVEARKGGDGSLEIWIAYRIINTEHPEGSNASKATYGGYKWETFVTAPAQEWISSQGCPPKSEGAPNTTEGYVSVVRSTLGGDLSLVYGGEVDAVGMPFITQDGYRAQEGTNLSAEYGTESKDELEVVLALARGQARKYGWVTAEGRWKPRSRHYIELKTSAELNSDGRTRSFEKWKAGKWWAQSYLLGVRSVVVGWRRENGDVNRVRWMGVDSLASAAAHGNPSWSPKRALTSVHRVLTWLKKTLEEELSPGVGMKRDLAESRDEEGGKSKRYRLRYRGSGCPGIELLSVSPDVHDCVSKIVPEWWKKDEE